MQVRENSYSGIFYAALAKDVNLNGLSKNPEITGYFRFSA